MSRSSSKFLSDVVIEAENHAKGHVNNNFLSQFSLVRNVLFICLQCSDIAVMMLL